MFGASPYVLMKAAGYGQRALWAAVFYVVSLNLLFMASTIYHWVNREENRRLWRKLDHAAIYLLIGGSTIPVVLLLGEGILTDLRVVGVLTVTFGGVFYNLFRLELDNCTSIRPFLYCAGFIVLLALPSLLAISGLGVLWLVIGGAFFLSGTIFFRWDSLPHNHSIWHCFVIGGAVSHLIGMVLEIVPLL